jgi:hypothetical protein
MKSTAGFALLRVSLVAGTLDILAACTNFYISTGKDPGIIFKYIASALLGPEAFAGGGGIIALGLLLHYIIASIWATLFFFLYPKLKLLRGQWIAVGVSYGLFVWVCMNRVVLPLSRVNTGPFNLQSAIIGATILVFAIGLPISYMVKGYYAKSNEN